MDDKLRKQILKILGTVIDPEFGKDIVSLEMILSLQISDGNDVILLIEVDPKRGTELENLRQEAERKISGLRKIGKVSVILTAENQKSKPASTDPHGMAKNPVIDVPAKQIILIASGKGGVGKSTVAANIASLLAQNYKVGLLDADIYGPSQAVMMGDEGYKPSLNDKKQLIPLEKYGLKIMSIGFMVDKSKALIWRGPMIQSALYQMLKDVAWVDEGADIGKKLDYLIIDMPPGTGDVQITLAQKVKINGAIIVSTPQDIALIDARRAVEMFNKTNIPIIGLVENMSTHICSACGHEEHIFGHGGARAEAKSLGIKFLGEIPLSRNIRENSDDGTPIVLAEPKSAQTQAFKDIIQNIGT